MLFLKSVVIRPDSIPVLLEQSELKRVNQFTDRAATKTVWQRARLVTRKAKSERRFLALTIVTAESI